MKEFKAIDSATSVEKLNMRLKGGEFEQYGEAFTPDFVYDVMKRLPRFVNMQVSIPIYHRLHPVLTLRSEGINKMLKSFSDSC